MTITEHRSGASRYIDMQKGLISREVFVSEEIFQEELENVFTRCWLFVGHESQIPNAGDYFVSRMGNDSVLMTKDNVGHVHVLLNSCRHRGMKVSRYDEGNTMEFYCPFHGWTYSVDGSLVTYPGELYGVPHYETAYGGKLDKNAWGLVPCAQVENYKGLIFATWDPDAPSFADYTGDFYYWLDNLTDGIDGTPGASEVFRGVHKWRVKSNWKFVAENFLGDNYHGGPSHASVEAVGIGPGGRRATRHGAVANRQGMTNLNNMRLGETSFVKLGHGSTSRVDSGRVYPFEAFGDHEPELRDYFKAAYDAKVARYAAENKPFGAMSPGNHFPNMSFHSSPIPRTILVAHPISATETEMWRWYFIDKDAPDFVRDWVRKYSMRYSGPGGLTEQDDMENWDYATDASRGTIARRYDYNYELGLGMTAPSEHLRGAVESSFRITEENARNYYRRWERFMDREDWRSLMSDETPLT